MRSYNYFAATIEETQDNATLSRKNDGAFYAHILEAGVEYTGIQLSTDYQLLLGLTARIPTSVDGSVKTTDKTNSTVDSTKLQSTEAVGGGVLANIGVSRGRWDVGIYYQGTSLELRDRGSSTEWRDGEGECDVDRVRAECGISILKDFLYQFISFWIN